MSTINSKTARELLEAYHAVYQTEETITEEQLWEEVEDWVFSAIDQGVDFSEYTLDEIAEAFIEYSGYLFEDEFGRAGRATGAALRSNVKGAVKGALDTAGSYYRGLVGKKTTSTNPAARLANTVARGITGPARFTARALQGALTGGGKSNTSASKTAPPSKFRDLGRQVQQNAPKNEPMVLRGVDGKPLGKPPSSSTGSTSGSTGRGGSRPTPAPTRPSTSSAAPSPAKTTPRPSAPSPAKQTGDKAKDMATWAKANPTLAAKKKTPNPLMQKTFGYQTGQQPTKPSGNIKPNVDGMKSGRLATAISGPNKKIGEGYDAYDIVLNYIAENGHAESLDEAHYIMMEMSPEMIQDIVETCINEGRRTSLSALSRESQKRKEDKKRGRPETEAETHGRLMLGKFRPGASKEERAEGGRERLRDRGKVPKKGGKPMFEQILEHLISEGYADTEESAIQIISNMGEDWMRSIVEGAALQNTIKTLEGKRDKMNAQTPGSANVSRSGKQSVGAATYKAYQRLKGV